MKAAVLDIVAVASLFFGAATAAAQTPVGVRRPELLADSGSVIGVIDRMVFGSKRPAATREDRRGKNATSEWNKTVDFSGPRFGITYLPKAVVDSLKAHDINVGSTISQFGWQLEHEIHVNPEGPMVLNEWVFLAGGLEKGVFLPSASWLVGARGRTGNEIAFGPNVSLAGVGLALAAGVTVKNGGIHFPMNVAAASSRGGIRVSFLTGFTLR
jgi:hypothetical protein